MESAFRKKVEAKIARALEERLKHATSSETAQADLEQLRRLSAVNDGLRQNLRGALETLKDAEFLDADVAASYAAEYEAMPPAADLQTITKTESTEDEGAPSRNARPPALPDVPTTELLIEPSQIHEFEPTGTWNKVEGDELSGFLEQINPIDGKYEVEPSTTKVAWSRLPFYESVALIRVTDRSWANHELVVYYLTDQGNLSRLNGTSPPIHEVNAKAPIQITQDNALDYLRFFCFFVRGEEGPFFVAESLTDAYMPEMPDDTVRSVFEGTMRPASLEGTNDNGHYLCDAVIFYSNALFIANFAIHHTGMVEMLDDEPIAADLPIRIIAPLS